MDREQYLREMDALQVKTQGELRALKRKWLDHLVALYVLERPKKVGVFAKQYGEPNGTALEERLRERGLYGYYDAHVKMWDDYMRPARVGDIFPGT